MDEYAFTRYYLRYRLIEGKQCHDNIPKSVQLVYRVIHADKSPRKVINFARELLEALE